MKRSATIISAPDLAEPRTGWILFAGAALLIAITVLPLIASGHPRPGPVDFHHIWTAGHMWASGDSPYDPSRAKLFAEHGLAHAYAEPAPFFYPPHSIALFAPLGSLQPGAASIAFSLFNALAFAAASVLGADIVRSAGARGSRLAWTSIHAIVLAGGWTATAVIFFHNIATLAVYAGLLAMLRGVQTGRGAYIVAGGFFALISPQIAVPAILALLLVRSARRAAVLAICAVALGSVAGLAPGGLWSSLSLFLANIGDYATYPANSHARQSGAGFLALALTGVSLHSAGLLVACAASLAALAAMQTRAGESETGRALEFAILSIVAGQFFLPSLSHYYVVTTPALLFLARSEGAWRMLAAAGALLLMRSLDILGASQAVFGLDPERTPAASDSVGILLLFAASVGAWMRGRAPFSGPVPTRESAEVRASAP